MEAFLWVQVASSHTIITRSKTLYQDLTENTNQFLTNREAAIRRITPTKVVSSSPILKTTSTGIEASTNKCRALVGRCNKIRLKCIKNPRLAQTQKGSLNRRGMSVLETLRRINQFMIDCMVLLLPSRGQ